MRWGIGSPEASHSAQVWVTRDMQRCRVSGQNELHFKVIELELGKISDECWENAVVKWQSGKSLGRQQSVAQDAAGSVACAGSGLSPVERGGGESPGEPPLSRQNNRVHDYMKMIGILQNPSFTLPNWTSWFVLYVHEFPVISAVLPPFDFIFKLHRGFLKFHGQCFAFHCHIAQVWHCRRQQL